jgi:hypothetical protein
MPESGRRPKPDPAAEAALMLRAILGAVERGEVQAANAQDVALLRRLQGGAGDLGDIDRVEGTVGVLATPTAEPQQRVH